MFRVPTRFFSFDYSSLEEPALKLEDDRIKQDNHLFTISNRTNSVQDLLKFYANERPNLSLLHNSVFLNKLTNTVKKSESQLDADELKNAEEVTQKVASYLFDNIRNLDAHSLLQTLKVLAFTGETKFKPSRAQLV